MSNQKVVEKLYEAGDKLDTPRQVDHWLYFKTEADRNCFISYAVSKKIKIENKEKIHEAKLPYKLQISRTDKVNRGSINPVTLELKMRALKCNGQYDSWETFVIK